MLRSPLDVPFVGNSYESCIPWRIGSFTIGKFVTFHIRRGDYQNVRPKDIVPDAYHSSASKKLSRLFGTAIVAGDSKVFEGIRSGMNQQLGRTFFLDSLRDGPFHAQDVSRSSEALVGLDGQFGLTQRLPLDDVFCHQKYGSKPCTSSFKRG